MILFLYQLLFPLMGVGVAARMLLSGRGRTLREGRVELRQRCGLLNREELDAVAPGRRVWFHAASVGEVAALKPLIELICASSNPPRLIVTTSTMTGRESARALKGPDLVALAPMDFYPAVSSFLSRLRPEALILVETELWPMTLTLAHRHGVRLGLVNGRITSRSFFGYRLLRFWVARWLEPFERVAVQIQDDAKRFLALGARPQVVASCGNMKFDSPLPCAESVENCRKRIAQGGWHTDKIWIAGSTRRGEEEIILKAHQAILKEIPAARLIMAPRHPERGEEVAAIFKQKGISFVRWSEIAGLPLDKKWEGAAPECILVDRLGVLNELYACASAAFVGGTLVPVGGHNLLEPAQLGKPVFFGPHTESIGVIARMLRDSGGGIEIANSSGLVDAVLRLFKDPRQCAAVGSKALETAQSLAGAAERSLNHLRPLLFPS